MPFPTHVIQQPMNSATSIPVLVGVAQLEQRLADPAEAREPLDLMLDAVRAAATDAGTSRLLSEATAVRVIRGAWRYEDPGRAIARELGVPQAETRSCRYPAIIRSPVTQAIGHFPDEVLPHRCLVIGSDLTADAAHGRSR